MSSSRLIHLTTNGVNRLCHADANAPAIHAFYREQAESAGLDDGSRLCPACVVADLARIAACPHPPFRLYSYTARDDRAPSGRVLVVACCECGQVLTGATE